MTQNTFYLRIKNSEIRSKETIIKLQHREIMDIKNDENTCTFEKFKVMYKICNIENNWFKTEKQRINCHKTTHIKRTTSRSC